MSNPFDPIAAIDAWLDESISPTDHAALDAWLAADPSNVRQLAARARLHRNLLASLTGAELATRDALRFTAPPPPSPAPTLRPPKRLVFSIPGAAAALLLTTAAAAIYVLNLKPETLDLKPPADRPVATVIDTSGGATLIVNDAAAWPGQTITAGGISLDTGSADFQLTNGVSVRLFGPAGLTIHSDMHATLIGGDAEFSCPPRSIGFTVDLPGGLRVVDLGTRFDAGVDADRRVRVHVLHGRVRIDRPRGESFEVAANQIARFDSPDAEPRIELLAGDIDPGYLATALSDSFDADSLDRTRWNLLGQLPPHTSAAIVDDAENRFGRGTANRVLRLLDHDRTAPNVADRPCYIGHTGTLRGHAFTLSFDFVEPTDPRADGAAFVRFIGNRGPFSNGKVYSLTLAHGRAAGDTDTGSARQAPFAYPLDRPVHADFVANHGDAPLSYPTPEGIRVLPPRRADLWLDGRLALDAFEPAGPESYNRPIGGVAFLSPSTATHHVYIDNVAVRPGAHVQSARALSESANPSIIKEAP